MNADMRLSFVMLVMLVLGGCAGQFVEGLRVMSGRGGTSEEIDTFPPIIQQAEQIKASNPAADWQMMFKADAADVFELLPGNRLLVGEVQVSTAIAEPAYGDLVLYDLNSGDRLWTFKRRDLEWGRYDLLAVDGDLLLIQGSSPQGGFYTAIDMLTGRLSWEREIKTTIRSAYDIERHRFYLLDVGGNEGQLAALDSQTGEVAWQKSLADAGPDSRILLRPDRDSLYVFAGGLCKVNTLTGAVSWQQPLPAAFEDPKTLKMRVTDQGVLLWDRQHAVLLNSQSGKKIWGPTYPGKTLGGRAYGEIKLLSASITSGRIFIWISDEIVSLDLRKGTKQWEYPLGSADLQSPFFFFDNRVYFTTFDSLSVLDAKNGRRLERIIFPSLEPGLFSSLTPDIFLAGKDKVFMLREGGAVYALSSRTNKLLWKQVLNWSYQMFFNTSQIDRTFKKSLTDKAHAEMIGRQSSLWWSAHISAMENQSRYYTSLGARKSFSSPDYGNLGSRGLIDTRSFDASMLFFQASLGLSDTIANSIKAAAQEGLAERLNMELGNATRNHLRSVQHGYFMRPYDSPKGMVVMLVHLDSGKRCDLFYSPSNIGLRYIDMRLPAFIIDPVSNTLYTCEIGTDVTRYEKYVKFKYGMPYPSILRYKLSDLKFSGD